MITFLYGSDAYRLMEAARPAVRLADGLFDTSDEGGLRALEDALKYPSLLADQRRLVISQAADSSDCLRLVREYDGASRTDLLITAVHRTAPKMAAATSALLAQWAKDAGETNLFEPMDEAQRAAWIRSFCSDRGTSADEEAIRLLTVRAGAETWTLASELEKLCAYCGAQPVSAEAVRLLTTPPDAYDQWALSNAVQAGDKRGAIAHLWTSLSRGVPEPLLAGTLASSVRTLLAVRDLGSRGLTAGAIAKEAGLHPFVVSKTLRFARTADRVKLAGAHGALAALDRNAKQGTADYADGLYGVLLTL